MAEVAWKTIWLVIKWLLSVWWILSILGALFVFRDMLSTLVYVVLLLLWFPPLHNYLEKKKKIKIPIWFIIIGTIVLVVIAGFTLGDITEATGSFLTVTQ